MRPIILIDFGSTYTKVTAVDLDEEVILGTSAAFTTADTDIGIGLARAFEQLDVDLGALDDVTKLACSSAAGGLRMMVSGLVPELTAEAARLAALGAGAKIIRVFDHELSRRDLRDIEAHVPDIFLLTGGTDGGNRDCIIGNAEKLASLPVRFPIIIAGNRSAVDDCEDILEDFPVTVCPNVMPTFGTLNIEPVQAEIRDLFLSRIITARGLTETRDLLSGILMPTPSSILSAMTLLAHGTDTERGIGDLMAVDVGGATTDVYSIGEGAPDDMTVVYKGLDEPEAKRTVEGDIGMRYSAVGIVDERGIETVAADAEMTVEDVERWLKIIADDKSVIPEKAPDLARLDAALAAGAIDVATRRHAGILEEAYTVHGIVYVQTGKNLTHVHTIVLTGGSLIHASDPLFIARHALYSDAYPASLRPRKARVLRDDRYMLSAMGVLAEREPDIALRIMKRELKNLGTIAAATDASDDDRTLE